jgi:hypothetical protein
MVGSPTRDVHELHPTAGTGVPGISLKIMLGLSKKLSPEYSYQRIFGRIDFCPFGDKISVVQN